MKKIMPLKNAFRLSGLVAALALISGCASNFESSPEPEPLPSRPMQAEPAPQPQPAPVARSGAGVYEDHLIRVTKNLQSGQVVGEPFTYNINVTAKQPVTNVEVDEFLPDSIQFQSANPSASTNQFGMPSWNLGAFDAGQTKTIQVTVVPQQQGEFEVCTVVRADPLICLPIFVGKPDLSITKTGPERAEVGSNVTWNVTVTNTGNVPANNVTISDSLPQGFSANSPLERQVGTLQPGQSTSWQVSATAPMQSGTFTNRACTMADGVSQICDTADIIIEQSSVRITKTGPAERFIFVPAEYLITVTNDGSTTLQNLTVTDQLPSGAQTVDDPANPRPMQSPVTFNISSLAPGESRDFTVTHTMARPGEATNTAVVRTPTGLTDQDNHTTLWKAVPGVVTTIVDNVDPIRIGENTTLTAMVQNQSRFENITVTSLTITLPQNLQVANRGGLPQGVSVSGQTISVSAFPLNPQQRREFNIPVTGVSAGTVTTVMETMTNFRTTPIIDQESTTIY